MSIPSECGGDWGVQSADQGSGAFEVLLSGPREADDMDIDAELRRQIIVSLLAAAVFLGGLVFIGIEYGTGTALPEAGGLALVGLLAGFVVMMAIVGAYLNQAGDESEEQ